MSNWPKCSFPEARKWPESCSIHMITIEKTLPVAVSVGINGQHQLMSVFKRTFSLSDIIFSFTQHVPVSSWICFFEKRKISCWCLDNRSSKRLPSQHCSTQSAQVHVPSLKSIWWQTDGNKEGKTCDFCICEKYRRDERGKLRQRKWREEKRGRKRKDTRRRRRARGAAAAGVDFSRSDGETQGTAPSPQAQTHTQTHTHAQTHTDTHLRVFFPFNLAQPQTHSSRIPPPPTYKSSLLGFFLSSVLLNLLLARLCYTSKSNTERK